MADVQYQSALGIDIDSQEAVDNGQYFVDSQMIAGWCIDWESGDSWSIYIQYCSFFPFLPSYSSNSVMT